MTSSVVETKVNETRPTSRRTRGAWWICSPKSKIRKPPFSRAAARRPSNRSTKSAPYRSRTDFQAYRSAHSLFRARNLRRIRNVRGVGQRPRRRHDHWPWTYLRAPRMIVANDATVKAGAFFPLTAKKVIRAQNISIENHIPRFIWSIPPAVSAVAGRRLSGYRRFGRVFRNNAVMSAMGISQITAIMGMCVAGGAYLPVMCDHILMTEGSGYSSRARRWCKRPSDRKFRPKS